MWMRPNEIAAGLTGAWGLFLRDAQALTLIDCSPRGAARSFQLAVFLLPVYVFLLALVWAAVWAQLDFTLLVLVEGLTWVIGWTAIPVIVYWLSGPMNVRDNWFAFVSAYNWSAPIQMAISLIVILMTTIPMFQGAMAFVVFLVATVIRLSYLMYVIKIALDVRTGPAIGLTALDFVLALILETQSNAVIRIGSGVAF